jgi:hypothetical protein
MSTLKLHLRNYYGKTPKHNVVQTSFHQNEGTLILKYSPAKKHPDPG